MNIPTQSVVVAHPAKQHVYQVVLALERAGLLRQLITGIYFKPNKFPYKMIRWLPVANREHALRELKKRRADELDDSLITTIPYFEVLSRTIGGLPPLIKKTEGRSFYLFANWASDLYVSYWITHCRKKPSILYAFLGSALQSFRRAKRMGIVTVLDVPGILHGPKIVAEEKRRLGFQTSYVQIERRLQQEVHMADYVITPSEAAAESVMDYGVSPNRVFVLPFGVNVDQFKPGPVDSQLARRKFRVIFVGKFALHKGVHYLLEAWRQLSLPDGELIVVGPPGESEFVESMRNKYGGSFTEYGNVPHYHLAALFSQADVFAFPSLAEGSALVTYEAQASGLPCVVTHEAGSVVRDGIEGFVVPSCDITELANRIYQLYQDKDLRRQMAVAARKRAEEFTWQRYHTHLVEILETVLRN
jgi:glycosyltransferase involved in cell wall biosynthesis